MSEFRFKELFKPIKLGTLQLKNRIVMSSMGTKYSVEHGHISQRQIAYYEARAKGGAGLINTEMVSVSFAGRHRDSQTALCDDTYISGFRKIADAVHPFGAKIAIQLNHAGREIDTSSTGYPPVSPSDIPTTSGRIPEVLSISEIATIVTQFAAAAKRAKEATIDGVEIHAAHSYLIASFLSGATNKRSDLYGGPIHNRARFLLEIIEAIKSNVGEDYPVWVRINGQEFGLENCLSLDESVQLARICEDAGVQAINVSAYGWGADNGKAPVTLERGNLVPLAENIKRVVKVPVIAVGKVDPELGEIALAEGKADLIAMGRSLLADPDLPNKVKENKLQDINPCITCMECGPRSNNPISCSVNAATGRETDFQIKRASQVKNIVVVGGGPAGMESARVAALRGHKVTLFEKKPELGGLLTIASILPHKKDLLELIRYLNRQITSAGIHIRLETEATPALIQQHNPDVVVVASGGKLIMPEIPGIESKNVFPVETILYKNIYSGENVVIIGGGSVGCEMANYLANDNRKVSIVEISSEVAQGLWPSLKTRLMGELAEKHVEIFPNTTCDRIETDKILATSKDGNRMEIIADTIVIAAGYKADQKLGKTFEKNTRSVLYVGNSIEPGKISGAILSGAQCALSI